MLGAVVGDIIGSAYEHEGIKTTDFPLFSEKSHFTDDTVMTLAAARSLMFCMRTRKDPVTEERFSRSFTWTMRSMGRQFPDAGYGRGFRAWLLSKEPHPYQSWGNASAMRVSPISWAFDDLETVERFAEITALPTHDHPEGIKGACSVAGAVFLARTGHSKDEIRAYITGKYGYDLSRSIDEIRPEYKYCSSCPGSLPEAFTAFLEGENFEDVIRKAVSLGGDADTLSAISGSIAEPFFGIPALTQVEAFEKLNHNLKYIVCKWEQWRN